MKTLNLNPKTPAALLPLIKGFTALFLFTSILCSFTLSEPGNKPAASRGKVPLELTGSWQKGNFQMASFFTFAGIEAHSADSSVVIRLSADGGAELYLYLPGFDGSCHTHTFAWVQGTAQVDGNQMVITARSGKYRGVFADACGGSNFERPMTATEVDRYVFRFHWSREQRDGKNCLVVRQQSNAGQGAAEYFCQVSW